MTLPYQTCEDHTKRRQFTGRDTRGGGHAIVSSSAATVQHPPALCQKEVLPDVRDDPCDSIERHIILCTSSPTSEAGQDRVARRQTPNGMADSDTASSCRRPRGLVSLTVSMDDISNSLELPIR